MESTKKNKKKEKEIGALNHMHRRKPTETRYKREETKQASVARGPTFITRSGTYEPRSPDFDTDSKRRVIAGWEVVT